MSSILSTFDKGKASVAYFMCGYPTLDSSYKAILQAIDSGVTMIELGVPFSDPTVQSSLLQEANLHAIQQRISMEKVFEFVIKLRVSVRVPIVLVTYANVVYCYGAGKFMRRCKEIGIQGLLIQDLPFEERDEFLPFCNLYSIDLISSIMNTNEQRIEMISKNAQGFINVDIHYEHVNSVIEMIRKSTSLPCVLNIKHVDTELLKVVAPMVDGVCVSEQIVELLKNDSINYQESIKVKILELKKCLKTCL